MQLALLSGPRIRIHTSGLDFSSLLLSDIALQERKKLLAADFTRGMTASDEASSCEYRGYSEKELYVKWVQGGKSHFVFRSKLE